MTSRENAYHGHQTDSERLEDIKRRHEALRVHSAKTDYAHRVIMDCEWLVSRVESLLEEVAKLRSGPVAGDDESIKASLEWLAQYEAARTPLGPSDFYESQEVAAAFKFCRVHGCNEAPEPSSWYCNTHIRRF